MSYNDGKPKKMSQIKDKEQAIIDFAEGSKALEELLRYAWSNGIATNSCCKGHLGKDDPFISFLLTNNSVHQLSPIINIIEYYPNVKLDIISSSEFKRTTLSISGSLKESEKLFSLITYILKNNQQVSNNVIEIVNDIANVVLTNKKNMNFKIINNEQTEYAIGFCNQYQTIGLKKENAIFFKKINEVIEKGFFPLNFVLFLSIEELEQLRESFCQKKRRKYK